MRERIIDLLKGATSVLSGEELSLSLGVSRTAVWKCIGELRAQGYDIQAASRHGYRLVSCPDLLTPSEIQFGLRTKILGRACVHFDSIASTMNEAFRLAMEGASEGTIVVAETQTKGRGRLGRSWSSPKSKGIYCSIILRPGGAPAGVAPLTLLTAVAVSEAVERVSSVRPLIKWPNDLLVKDKKLCGILTEMRAETDRIEFVIIGIGLNVNSTPRQLVPEAVSLKQVLGHSVSRVILLQEVLRAIESRYIDVQKNGFGATFVAWRERSATIGRKVRFQEKGGMMEGVAVDLDSDGGLLVKLASGKIIKKISGDILL
ncbi:MAG: biotin--[acetyl-CoA-carboxylase] ligase [Candidatus Omnitrophica bacterium]|nr:biotin--[acetyl-CoA-carboxylase] ligase [Candidatus Omnitrophota bacterium]